MRTDSSPPIDPRLHELLQQHQPGPVVLESALEDVAARTPAAWEALAARVAEDDARPENGGGRHRRSITRGRFGFLVATACVLVSLGVGTWKVWSGPSMGGTTRSFATKPGEQMTVRLGDGSTIRLAPATALTVAESSVELTGAAYFTVSPHASRPLTVRTRNAVVHVLGTRFEVRQYTDEVASRVVVEEGKVAVRVKRHGVVSDVPTAITARMMAQVSDSGVSVTPVNDTRTLTGWRNGMLVFDGAPLRDVVVEIARCYNAVIRVEGNDLANETLDLDVVVRRISLNQVLGLVSGATNAHVRRDGNVYVLVPGRDVAIPRGKDSQRSKTLPEPEKMYGR